jgi:hypothetical protein
MKIHNFRYNFPLFSNRAGVVLLVFLTFFIFSLSFLTAGGHENTNHMRKVILRPIYFSLLVCFYAFSYV